jgi:hypothetical protein
MSPMFPSIRVPLGDTHDQAQICFDQLALSLLGFELACGNNLQRLAKRVWFHAHFVDQLPNALASSSNRFSSLPHFVSRSPRPFGCRICLHCSPASSELENFSGPMAQALFPLVDDTFLVSDRTLRLAQIFDDLGEMAAANF